MVSYLCFRLANSSSATRTTRTTPPSCVAARPSSPQSPQGKLHQVEYALEAVKQGSAAIGLRSSTHAVLLTLKRSTGELATYQKKLIDIDDHVGIAIAGLTSDARVLRCVLPFSRFRCSCS